MSTLKVAALGVALAGGLFTLAPVAGQAQEYRHDNGHGRYQQQYRYAPQPQYVDPYIQRKQAQLARRFHEKYGYVQPQPQYGYGYQRNDGYGYRRQRGYNEDW
jgi:hypothetical protein